MSLQFALTKKCLKAIVKNKFADKTVKSALPMQSLTEIFVMYQKKNFYNLFLRRQYVRYTCTEAQEQFFA